MDKKPIKSQKQIRSLRGKLHWTGDLDAMRCDSVIETTERASISSVLAEWEQIDDEWPEIEDPPSRPVEVDPE
jgi:hypothetical protein